MIGFCNKISPGWDCTLTMTEDSEQQIKTGELGTMETSHSSTIEEGTQVNYTDGHADGDFKSIGGCPAVSTVGSTPIRSRQTKNMKTSQTDSDRNRQIRLLLGSLIALVTADGVITRFLVAYELAHEGNPLLQKWISVDAFLIIKLAGAFLAALIFWDVYKRHPRLSLIVTVCSVITYTVIVFWNLTIYVFMAGRV